MDKKSFLPEAANIVYGQVKVVDWTAQKATLVRRVGNVTYIERVPLRTVYLRKIK